MRRLTVPFIVITLMLLASASGVFSPGTAGAHGGHESSQDPNATRLDPELMTDNRSAGSDGNEASTQRQDRADGTTVTRIDLGEDGAFTTLTATACVGTDYGAARYDEVDGGFRVRGTLTGGATGIEITTKSGKVFEADAIGTKEFDSPVFVITVDSAPVSFHTIGGVKPRPCPENGSGQ